MSEERKLEIACALLKGLVASENYDSEEKFINSVAKDAKVWAGISHDEAIEFATIIRREIVLHVLFDD